MQELACQILKGITKLKTLKNVRTGLGKDTRFYKKQNKNIGYKYTDQCVCGFTISERRHSKRGKGH